MNSDGLDVQPGDLVAWKWGFGVAEGIVLSVHYEKTQILSKGKLITRLGTTDNPAIVIQHKNGNQVLKRASELLPLKDAS